jgi:hypothetical protein
MEVLDNVSFVDLFHELLTFALDCSVEVPVVYQYITSVITLVTVRGGKVRTKHMRVWMHLVREAIAEKRVTVKHVQTLEMIADRLTKTLDGADFDFFTNNVLGANKSISGH